MPGPHAPAVPETAHAHGRRFRCPICRRSGRLRPPRLRLFMNWDAGYCPWGHVVSGLDVYLGRPVPQHPPAAGLG